MTSLVSRFRPVAFLPESPLFAAQCWCRPAAAAAAATGGTVSRRTHSSSASQLAAAAETAAVALADVRAMRPYLPHSRGG